MSFCNIEEKGIERHLHALMCSVSVVAIICIHTMEDDQRLNTLVHKGDALCLSLQHGKIENSLSILGTKVG